VSRRILIAGGGTGGHVVPALATAAALRAAAGDVEVEFVGTARGLEARLVPQAGWRLHEIEAAPLARRLSSATLRLPVVVARATRTAATLLARPGTAAALVFGGYVSVPLALAAGRTRTPLVVHEQNAVPGIANRLAARWARAVAVTVPASARRFRRAREVVVTGNPVRPGLSAAQGGAGRAAAAAAFGLDPARRTLLVFGGSQGARRINAAIVASAARWPDPGSVQMLHASGRAEHAAARAAWDAALAGTSPGRRPLVACVPFLDRMDLAYALADVVVCRAGASTLAELTVLGLPSVLVPYPHATADHQTANARALADAGAAVTIPDAEVDGDRLVGACQPLLADESRRSEMAANARALGRPDAAQALAELVLRVAARPGEQGARS
jgi:UDP-N-acetylglucosamine--N-acetylmuramyl-(pentapeptide) pyrophosphoryl-undecaprenol N-acetylglucosamine transferase